MKKNIRLPKKVGPFVMFEDSKQIYLDMGRGIRKLDKTPYAHLEDEIRERFETDAD